MNSVFYDRASGTIDIYISNPVERSEYSLRDSSDKILIHGCVFGKIRKTCLYVGDLRRGDYFIQINDVRLDFQGHKN